MSKNALINAMLLSIDETNATYENWSGGLWIGNDGSEGLLVADMARRLIETLRGYKARACLTVETSFAAIAHSSGARRKPGPVPAILNHNSRADIALWKNSEDIYGAVEVKTKWNQELCLRDLDRLNALRNNYGGEREGCFEFGAAAISLMCGADPDCDKMYARYDEIKAIAKDRYDSVRIHALEPKKPAELPDNPWTRGGVVIEFY